MQETHLKCSKRPEASEPLASIMWLWGYSQFSRGSGRSAIHGPRPLHGIFVMCDTYLRVSGVTCTRTPQPGWCLLCFGGDMTTGLPAEGQSFHLISLWYLFYWKDLDLLTLFICGNSNFVYTQQNKGHSLFIDVANTRLYQQHYKLQLRDH